MFAKLMERRFRAPCPRGARPPRLALHQRHQRRQRSLGARRPSRHPRYADADRRHRLDALFRLGADAALSLGVFALAGAPAAGHRQARARTNQRRARADRRAHGAARRKLRRRALRQNLRARRARERERAERRVRRAAQARR